MYYVYVIKSIPFGNLYKGFCTDLEKRLKEHNAGKTKSNKAFRPWELLYNEECATLEMAIKREKYFKSAAGRKTLKKILDSGSPPD